MKTAILTLFAAVSISAGQEVWTLRYSPIHAASPAAIAGRPGLYLAGPGFWDGEKYEYSKSNDGISWSQVVLPEASSMAAIGQDVIGAGSRGIWKTSNGTSFTWVYQAPVNQELGFPKIAIGETCLVVTAQSGRILRAASLNAPWLPQLSPADSITGITYGGGFFLASTGEGMIKSTDGITWVEASTERKTSIQGFAAGAFYSGEFYSFNGSQWSSYAMPDAYYGPLVAAGPVLCAVNGRSKIFLSTDFINWTSRPSGMSGAVFTIGFCGDLWVAASDTGKIATSPATSAPALAAPAVAIKPAVELSWPSITGRQYQVQGSNNNTAWSNVGLPLLGNGSTLTFTAPANETRKFFRVEAR